MLTRKQHELLTYLQRYLSEHGVAPSFDEMKEAVSLRSKSGIHRLITGLEERGFVRRLPHRARAIEILRLPEDSQPRQPRFKPNVIEGRKPPILRNLRRPAEAMAERISPLPLFGKIAAGTPIEALRNEQSFVDVPQAMVGAGEHYALEVEGDSMIDAGIFDGDVVIIERAEAAENGAIVVALIDEQEVTLKRLRRRAGAIALEPANRTYETRLFPPDRVRIQGRLRGLLRRY